MERERLEQDPRPLSGYALMTSAYGVGLGAYLIHRGTRGGFPERSSVADLALSGIATHRLSRVISKEDIAAPIRAPLTELEGRGDLAESSERAREDVGPVRRALGKLLSCPYCLDQWVATGFAIGMVERPRETRFVAGVLTSATAANYLQAAYKRAIERD